MSPSVLARTVYLLLAGVGVAALKCESMPSDLPCVEISRCRSGDPNATVTIDSLSNGLGKSKAVSTVSLCFTDTDLYLHHEAAGQLYLGETSYQQCNSAIFNSNVAEFFVAPTLDEPHCYNELDISPFDVMYDAGIYNPNLNHTSVQGTTFDCATSSITHSTSTLMSENQWKVDMSIPFSLLNCPYNCPQHCPLANRNGPHDSYRVNFFRISQLTQNPQCSSSTCEYMAWSPTDVNPPAFHEPLKFGNLLLQF
ncbi:hypothetical protein B484DRAFT_444936 [Ochromonadaceae sp. CCMP2298]|nr:hypothetical protein B484DRAFT_444936 [Ochromonadaceae sp. CCMP2298]|mmetsp:Transcript_14145/g.31233  ORF Transcript_14145/g.31233 Transcript_14145/m.31233 type:complete len:253 (-) Transcript_14145:200-958(-)